MRYWNTVIVLFIFFKLSHSLQLTSYFLLSKAFITHIFPSHIHSVDQLRQRGVQRAAETLGGTSVWRMSCGFGWRGLRWSVLSLGGGPGLMEEDLAWWRRTWPDGGGPGLMKKPPKCICEPILGTAVTNKWWSCLNTHYSVCRSLYSQ